MLTRSVTRAGAGLRPTPSRRSRLSCSGPAATLRAAPSLWCYLLGPCPPTTGCSSSGLAIDRIVHHATILELDGPSFRSEAAKRRAGDRPNGAETAEESVRV